MRTRGRTYPRHRRRTQRDASPTSSASYRAVPLAQFRREVVALLKAGRPSFDSFQALRLVSRWDRMVRLRHLQGKPPCNVADHIRRYERDGAVCPCGNTALAARDKDRGACRRCSRRDPSRWERVKAWRDRKIVTRRKDFEDITHNVGEVTKAAAKGQMPEWKNLRYVKNPISRLVERDPRRKRSKRRRRRSWRK